MAKSAVIFGAGNIGRGFIGQLFSESGYEVVFIDVDQELIDTLNRERQYRLEAVSNDGVQTHVIGPVRAINSKDSEAVAEAVAAASLGATAVGANALKYIAPGLASGLALRAAASAESIHFIICENLHGAAAHFRQLVSPLVPESALVYFTYRTGFVDTVIGRMVPVPTAEMRASDVSLIRVEPYKELPVDQRGFVAEIPAISAMSVHDDFAVYTARKLYIHNCGHALMAYVGYLHGYELGYQAMADEKVRGFMQAGLQESASAICAEYGASRDWLEQHVQDLLHRFCNKMLGDTIFRLGRDPLRKLAPEDRLTGAAQLADKHGLKPVHLAWGMAAAMHFNPKEDDSAQQLQAMIRDKGAAAALQEVTGVNPESNLGKMVLEAYQTLKNTPLAMPGAT